MVIIKLVIMLRGTQITQIITQLIVIDVAPLKAYSDETLSIF